MESTGSILYDIQRLARILTVAAEITVNEFPPNILSLSLLY